MKDKSYRFSALLLIISYSITACGNGQAVTTPLVTPTETESLSGATFTGNVVLSNGNEEPYPTSVELILKHSLIVTHRVETDSAGMYIINNVQPGEYEFWVLITSESSMIPGCSDVIPPNDTLLGIKLGDRKAVTLEQNPSLNKAFNEARFVFENDGSKADGYYAIFPNLEIKSGKEKIDVILTCE
jgi:hypothetical protein